MKDIEKCPVCGKEDCFGCDEGHCIVLSNNKFKDKECPFYKTKQQAEKDNANRLQRLANIGREVNYYA